MKSSVYPKTVALLITKQCTAQCEMCCFECTPQTKEKIPMELIIKIIEEAALIDDIETIGFSGFSYEEALKIVSEIRLAGLDRLSLSVDQFHAKYVGIDCVKNILRASNKISLAVEYLHMHRLFQFFCQFVSQLP
ncbi:MAG: hypothetical protein R3Y67_01520 [Eubacteriales bacterium]